MLACRKNHKFGCRIERSCFCNAKDTGLKTAGFKSVCPVCRVWPYINSKVRPGQRLFPNATYKHYLDLLKRIIVSELKLKMPAPIGTHSLRRGCLQSMEQKGGTAVELFQMGLWNSKCINIYRDLKKSEENAFLALADVELADDEDEEVADEDAWMKDFSV